MMTMMNTSRPQKEPDTRMGSDPQEPSLSAAAGSNDQPKKRGRHRRGQHIILFYKYHPLSDDPSVTDAYRRALEGLCRSLGLMGRILVGCSSTSEGINGTLAGSFRGVKAFALALSELQTEADSDSEGGGCDSDRSTAFLSSLSACGEDGDDDELALTLVQQAVEKYWRESRSFFDRIAAPVLVVPAHEFKWSVHHPNLKGEGSTLELFPDLIVKLVDELIGSGGVMKDIPIAETARGYLTPQEWHDEVSRRDPNATVLIDCRNAKECEIGRFDSSINPQTTTFSQFPAWVEQNRHLLENKTVYMSCTGGIRCEKSAAYIRRAVPSAANVLHLWGGIHKYLEEYGDRPESLWKGRNFVFDGRGAATARETFDGRDGGRGVVTSVGASGDPESVDMEPQLRTVVVGRCVSCQCPFDRFDPSCVCTVCREPTLVCPACQQNLAEYHCRMHQHLRRCYFSDLSRFSAQALDRQLDELETLLADIAVGRRFKSKRRTLVKQIAKIRERQLATRESTPDSATDPTSTSMSLCRNCGEPECSGPCWGFYGLKRKQMLERQTNESGSVSRKETIAKQARIEDVKLKSSAQTRVGAAFKRQQQVEEIVAMHLSLPPSSFRDASTGIRVVPVVTRVVQCRAKGRWCGQPVLSVLKEEFAELTRPGVLRQVMDKGLLRINCVPIDPLTAGRIRVRMKDTIGRVLHWHEPPVQVPVVISVQTVRVPDSVIREFGLDPTTAELLVCDKPATVPVHPAGPYLANTLTLMVEAQEQLHPLSLIPVHRTDRVTSGLTLCARDPAVSRAFHKSLTTPGAVRKLYLALVAGRFYGGNERQEGACQLVLPVLPIGSCGWQGGLVKVDAPVETIDAANGLRAVTAKGKPSTSLFQHLAYSEGDNTSLIACFPVTGRNHQLRVHLQLLGFPIVGDAQYAGRSTMDEESNRVSRAALDLMNLSLQLEGADGRVRLPSLLEEDVRAARSACPACSDGDATSSFTPAQLLREGHAIRLHALRYQVSFLGKKASNQQAGSSDATLPPLAICDFRVDPPAWAKALLGNGDGDMLRDLPFLETS